MVKVVAMDAPEAGKGRRTGSSPGISRCRRTSTAWAGRRWRAVRGAGVKLLLDTHMLLWAAGEPERLPAEAAG